MDVPEGWDMMFSLPRPPGDNVFSTLSPDCLNQSNCTYQLIIYIRYNDNMCHMHCREEQTLSVQQRKRTNNSLLW